MFRPYYNESVRKLIVAFGSLFNNIRIENTDSGGNTNYIRVPLSYGPKEKFIRRIEESSSISGSTKVQITLPRLGFNITDIVYDPSRKRNTLGKRYYYKTGATGGHPSYSYSEVPYNFNISLYSFTRTMTDSLQIMEQILPYFTPEFNVTVKFSDLNPSVDIPIILTGVNLEEEYEGDFDTRRNLTSQYDFTVKSSVFGEVKQKSTILYTETTFFELVGDNYKLSGPTGALSRVDVGVSGPSFGSAGFTSNNFITYENIYTIGPSGGSTGYTGGRHNIDTYGNTYPGASYNPPN
tara:strand:+ start:361 stop:1242 length:882 start_codon:yes stop_codon:yes gene_type:complete